MTISRTTSTLQRNASRLDRNTSRLDRNTSRREGSTGPPVWDGSGGPEPKTNAMSAAREAEDSGKGGEQQPEKAETEGQEKPKKGFLSMICPCMGS